MKGVTEINNMGFKDKMVPTKMKKALYESLARSKLIYGLETIKMDDLEVKSNLSTLEGNVIKRANSLGSNSRTTSLLYAMNITPIGLQLKRRKINFVQQLLRNDATRELVTNKYHRSIDDIIDYIGINEQHKNLDNLAYEGCLLSACAYKLNEIKLTEKQIVESKLVKAICYLLNNRNENSDGLIKYLLDPKRGKKG
jgi:hypothetical protein